MIVEIESFIVWGYSRCFRVVKFKEIVKGESDFVMFNMCVIMLIKGIFMYWFKYKDVFIYFDMVNGIVDFYFI